MNFNNLTNKLNLGNIISTTKLTGGLMHQLHKVETDKGVYAIKVLNKEVMARSDAYNNFVISETISNLAKENNIPVSNALKINGDFIIKYENNYYMVFDFLEGKVLNDDEITLEHCKQIGEELSKIHNLDYNKLELDTSIKEENIYIDWGEYINNKNFNNMSYKDLYLDNYNKYYSILKRSVERFNSSHNTLSICHRDMDPKNVMWNKNSPIVIDWESASIDNPYIELLEVALCWSGFLSNNFDEEKFISVINSYSKNKDICNVDWYDIICGNLLGRFNWLNYNLKRSLAIITNDVDEIKLSENEVIKTINEINRYLDLIGTMYDMFEKLTNKEVKSYDDIIVKLIDSNELLKNSNYKLINSGFTNTIYEVDNYIVRICTNKNNEERFKNEIDFYNKYNNTNTNIPKLYFSDITKNIVPYYYQIMEKVNGVTLYEIWYKLNEEERFDVVIKIIDIFKSFHLSKVQEYDFNTYIKKKINILLNECNLNNESFTKLFNLCNKYFCVNKFGLIHGDLHFDNFIYNEGEIKLLDFERCMIAPIDYDFKLFSRYYSEPWLWASAKTDMLTVENDYQDLITMFIDNYEELSKIPYLKERLKIYEIMELLNNYKNTKNINRLNNVYKIINELGD